MNQKREGIKYTLSHTDKRKAGGAKHFTAQTYIYIYARNKKERRRKKERKEKENKQAKTGNERKQVGKEVGWKDGRKEGRKNLKTDGKRKGNLPQTRHIRCSDKESESVASVCFSRTR